MSLFPSGVWEVRLKIRIFLAALSLCLAGLPATGVSAVPLPGIIQPNLFVYFLRPRSSWLDFMVDAIGTCSYFVVYACIFWVLIKLRRIPEVRAYRWSYYIFATFILCRAVGRLVRMLVDWGLDASYWNASRIFVAIISFFTAACFSMMAGEVARRIHGFVKLFLSTREEKDLALLALSASENQAQAVRAQTALQLAETTGRYQLLVEGVTDHALFTVDYDGVVTSWNRGAERLLGYREEEIAGASFSIMLTAEDREAGSAELLLKKAQQMRQAEDEGWRVRKNGERFWARVTKTALPEEDGYARGFAVIMQDLTSHKEAERVISDKSHRIEAVVSNAVDGMIVIDDQGTVDSFNPACERIFGYQSEEVIGQNVKILMPEPYHSQHDGYLTRYNTTGEGVIIGTAGREVSGRRKDGSVFPMDLSVSAFRLESGRYFSGIVRDITERKKIENALAETTRNLRLLVEGVRDHALFTVDPAGLVTSWNRGAERLLGYTEPDILGQSFFRIFTAEDIQAGVPERQMNLAREQSRAEDDGWRIRADGERFWADVVKTALFEEGVLRGFAVLMRDVTERRKITQAMEEAREERIRLQERFLSHVSHELRTPLTAIYFFTTNVLDGLFGELTRDQHEQLSLVLDNAKQLKDMVSDLLDITRVESHKLYVASQPAKPNGLIKEVIGTCQTHAETKNVSLQARLTTAVPFVWADPARVRQILTNLIENAVKFTPEGGLVTVSASVSPEHDGFLMLSVSDTGCGIAAADCEVIFDRLTQLKHNTDASRAGLGLGLFITRELVLRHGGRIWVKSILGEGSTFYFTLPVFSLPQWCARVLADPIGDAGCVTLIAVDAFPSGGAIPRGLLHELKRMLERCIQPGQDVILPVQGYSEFDHEEVETIFIAASTGAVGLAVIESRIKRELQNSINISRFRPIITSHTVSGTSGLPREQQIEEITQGIERLVQEHLASNKERAN